MKATSGIRKLHTTALERLIAGMASRAIRTRSGDPYKPSSVRGYHESFDLSVRDDFGAMRLGDVKRRHVQAQTARSASRSSRPSTPPR